MRAREVAKSFDAVCTPEFYLFDQEKTLRYHGRLDDSWKDDKSVKEQSLKLAIEQVLEGHEPSESQIPSMGCSIKWKK